jgi:hypothetical protein
MIDNFKFDQLSAFILVKGSKLNNSLLLISLIKDRVLKVQ